MTTNKPPSVTDAVDYLGFKIVVLSVSLLIAFTAFTVQLTDTAPDKTVYRLLVISICFVTVTGIAVHMRGSIDGFRKGARATSDHLQPIIDTHSALSAKQAETIREQTQRIADLLGDFSVLQAENGRLRAELRREIAAEDAVHGEAPDQATLTALSNGPRGHGRGGIVGI